MMEKKVRKLGGAREGAGRKPKADEIKLIESMDAIAVPDNVWRALYKKVQDGDTQAIKTWLQYRFGMPRQTIDQTTNHNFNNFDVKNVLSFKD